MNERKHLPYEIQVWCYTQWNDHRKGTISNLFNFLADHLDKYIALTKNPVWHIRTTNISLILINFLKGKYKSKNWSKPANEKINDINIFNHLEAILRHLEICRTFNHNFK